MRRLLLVLCVAVLALGAAGCGDTEEENAYINAVNQAQKDFGQTFRRIQSRITPTSTPEQDRRTYGEFLSAVDDAVADLRAIQPPDGVESLHGRLVAAIGRYGRAIEDARAASGSPDPRKVLAAQTELTTQVAAVSKSINGTIEEINERLKG